MNTNSLWLVKVPTIFNDYGKAINSVNIYIVKALTYERAIDIAVLACGSDSVKSQTMCTPFDTAFEKRLLSDGAVLVTSI